MIDLAVLIIGALAVIVAVAAFSRRTGIAAPLLLLLIGVAAGYLPGMPDLTTVKPAIILDVVLPPLLYASAVNLPAIDLRRNLPAIGGLAVVLVLVSTVVVGLVLYAVFPDLRLAAAIAVGAVVSPTDAVAATSIAKRLGLPERLITVLEGESLVNDATALVLLRSAITAVAASATIDVGAVAAGLVSSVVVAIAVGLAVGYGTVAIRARISDPVLTTAISFVVPFVAFLPADQLGGSGVLAAVVAGLVTGHRGARSFAPAQRINDHTNWRTVQFVLEEGVFLAMGLQFKPLLEQLESPHARGTPLDALLVGLFVVGVLLGLRAAYVLAEVPLLRWRERRIQGRAGHLDAVAERVEAYEPPDAQRARRKRRISRSVAQRRADLAFLRENGLSLRGGTVVAWAGMRGVVTLAAAQSLPPHLPYRALLVMVAFVVAVVSLLGFGGTLPLVIRITGIRSADQATTRRELRRLLDHVHGVSMAVLDDPKQLQVGGARPDPEVLELLRTRFTRPDADDEPDDATTGPGRREQYVVLRRRMREAAREELLDARTLGSYSSAAISTAQDLLDLNDAREDRLADEF